MQGFKAKNIKTGEILISEAKSIHPIMNAIKIHCQMWPPDHFVTLPHGRKVLTHFKRGYDIYYLTEDWIIAENDDMIIF